MAGHVVVADELAEHHRRAREQRAQLLDRDRRHRLDVDDAGERAGLTVTSRCAPTTAGRVLFAHRVADAGGDLGLPRRTDAQIDVLSHR